MTDLRDPDEVAADGDLHVVKDKNGNRKVRAGERLTTAQIRHCLEVPEDEWLNDKDMELLAGPGAKLPPAIIIAQDMVRAAQGKNVQGREKADMQRTVINYTEGTPKQRIDLTEQQTILLDVK